MAVIKNLHYCKDTIFTKNDIEIQTQREQAQKSHDLLFLIIVA